jgi:hypothetical protein
MNHKDFVVNCKNSEYDIYIGRPSKWGNPFTHISDKKTLAKFVKSNRYEAIESYKEWLLKGEGSYLLRDLDELKGKILGCWCHPKSCHGHFLSELVNKGNSEKNLDIFRDLD